MLPVVPQAVNKLIQDNKGNLSTYPFPRNIAGDLSKDMRKSIFQWMLQSYLWPQVQNRKPYEAQWDKLLDMARATWKNDNGDIREGTRLERDRQARVLEGKGTINDRLVISDTVIYNAVDRLTNLNHFVSFKESLPVRFELPSDVIFPCENDVYSPMSALVKAANGWLNFNAKGTSFFRKHWMMARHHYTYGVSYAESQFEQKIAPVKRRQEDKSFKDVLELTKIGVTFNPISIRKLWLNTNLSPYDMDYQPCPFFFEQIPRFAIIANKYDAGTNPFGYCNLDTIPRAQWLFGDETTEAFQTALKSICPEASLEQLMRPEYNVELKWTMYPMLPLVMIPLDQLTEDHIQGKSEEELQSLQTAGGMWDFDTDGTKNYPFKRFIVECFGNKLITGGVEILRIQENFYPNDSLPIFGSAHQPDLDSGQYSPAIGTVLESHYIQISKALNQFLVNKDLLNDPPAKVQASSPALAHDLNKPGAKIPVNSMNDYETAAMVDGTGSTTQFIEAARTQAQTSSKAVDAILGKAMGSRTSATEASNIFQTAMSGVTTDINLFNFDIAGGFAERCWEYAGLWVDPDVLAMITGQYGFAVRPEHMAIRLGLKWDIGSSYIESLTRQGNYRYLLESSRGDPAINRAELYRCILTEWKMLDVSRIVNDGGMNQEIQQATEQAIRTYLGELVLIDPDQNHQVALKIKLSFLKDRESTWNTNPEMASKGAVLVQQIELHQKYLQLQMMQQMLQAQQPPPAGSLQSLQSEKTSTDSDPAANAGEIAQRHE